MCWCNPKLRAPCCGKESCHAIAGTDAATCPWCAGKAVKTTPEAAVRFLRKVNDFFHVDETGRLVKTSTGIPVGDDEPVLIFRGRDVLAVDGLYAYKRFAELSGCTSYLIDGVQDSIQKFEAYAANNPTKMKQPGVTQGQMTEAEKRERGLLDKPDQTHWTE